MAYRHLRGLVGKTKTKFLSISASAVLIASSIGGAAPLLFANSTAAISPVYDDGPFSLSLSCQSGNVVMDMSADQTVSSWWTGNVKYGTDFGNKKHDLSAGDHDTWSNDTGNYSIPAGIATAKITGIYGLFNFYSHTFTVNYPALNCDTTPPTVNNIKMFVNGIESTFMRPGDTIKVVANIADPSPGSGVNTSNVRLLARSIATTNGGYIDSGYFLNTSGDTFERTFIFPTDGKYIDTHKPITQDLAGLRFYIKAFDIAGNYTNSTTTTFTNDQTIPSMQNIKMYVKDNGGIYVPSNFVKAGDQVRVEVEATDQISGVKNVEFRIQDANTGAYVAPRVYESTPASGDTYRYDFTMPNDNKYYNTHGPITENVDGLKFWARATDNVGNYGNGTNTNGLSGTFTLDNSAPAITLNSVATTLNSTVTLSGTASDTGSGLRYGNTDTTSGERVRVSFRPLAGGTAGAPVHTYFANVDTSGIWTLDVDTTDGWFVDGQEYRIVARANDNVGTTYSDSNTAADTADSVIDNTAPVLAINPSSGTDTTPTITGTINDLTVLDIVINIDGGGDQLATNNGDGTWSFTPASPLTTGTHQISVSATDTAGNTGTTTDEFTINPVTAVLGASTSTGSDSSSSSSSSSQGDESGAGSGIAEVLGDSTDGTDETAKTSDSSVKGDSTEKTASTTTSNFLGLGWWWLLVLAAALAGWWFIFGARRRKNEDN